MEKETVRASQADRHTKGYFPTRWTSLRGLINLSDSWTISSNASLERAEICYQWNLIITGFGAIFKGSNRRALENTKRVEFAIVFHLKIFLSVISLSSSSVSPSSFSGLRKGNEIMTLNGEAVSDLDLKQMEALFSEKSVGLTLIARPPDTKATLCSSWSDSDLFSRDQKGLLPPPNQSQLLEEFLDHFKKDTANGKVLLFLPFFTAGITR